MATNPTPQVTDFTRDVVGRYVCNGLDEALQSMDTSRRPDARPFDFIIIGGGTFGSVLAQQMFSHDKKHGRRILVLESGSFVLPEHVQNLPMLGLDMPSPTTIADLRATGQERAPRNEVWGLPWHSNVPFPGLAYCIGGRSLFWGGWAPQPLDSEMPALQWPDRVLNDLANGYFREASEQTGLNETNDFVHGALHEVLRQRLFDGLNAGKVTDAIPLPDLPLHLENVPPGQEELYKVEAPLAVQNRPPRPGLFPLNKFSAVPMLIKAARAAWADADGDDVKKRLMVVPHCHVKRLVTGDGRVTAVETNLGTVPVPPHGAVVLALGTIESTRLAQLSFEGIPNYHLMGQNLMAHVRSTLAIRFDRSALPIARGVRDLQASALFVKGQHRHGDGTPGHFHLEITAAGLGTMDADSEAELFRKVPDIDTFHIFRATDDAHVVINIRGVGEMEPQNSIMPASRITLDPELDEFGMRRAKVVMDVTDKDRALWDVMDKAAEDVAKVLADGRPFEVLSKVRDPLGATHHEAGTLWMGDDPRKSITRPDGRFHHVTNAYVAGPALFPTIGSPSPMLTGIALTQRMGQLLAPDPMPYKPGAGFRALFDGFRVDNWRMAGKGHFMLVDGTLESVPGDDLGLYWCTTATPPDFVLKLEWLRWRHDDSSGVFVRFPNPTGKGYGNPAYVAADLGFEVQIDELGAPDGADVRKTCAIYSEPTQTLTPRPARPAGEWNELDIRVQGQTYTVFLNGEQVTEFRNPHADRGLPSTPEIPSYIGLQSDPGKRVAFRNIRIKSM
jgi:choline dehydrogenase-like flavoprotein